MKYSSYSAVLTLFALVMSILPTNVQADCVDPAGLSDFVHQTYDDQIVFDVIRNGKVVGSHRTVFSRSSAGLHAHSSMQLTVTLLFIPVFDFAYDLRSTWCNNQMVALDATVDRNGRMNSVKASFDGAATTIQSSQSLVAHPATLIPTDHWNPAVLQKSHVLNTITGHVNEVDIVSCPAKKAKTLGLSLPAEAHCFEYTGDLAATVWYLQQRWIGLAFQGDDGSDIVYRCSNCRVR